MAFCAAFRIAKHRALVRKAREDLIQNVLPDKGFVCLEVAAIMVPAGLVTVVFEADPVLRNRAQG